jgi:hypothetical protein
VLLLLGVNVKLGRCCAVSVLVRPDGVAERAQVAAAVPDDGVVRGVGAAQEREAGALADGADDVVPLPVVEVLQLHVAHVAAAGQHGVRVGHGWVVGEHAPGDSLSLRRVVAFQGAHVAVAAERTVEPQLARTAAHRAHAIVWPGAIDAGAVGEVAVDGARGVREQAAAVVGGAVGAGGDRQGGEHHQSGERRREERDGE